MKGDCYFFSFSQNDDQNGLFEGYGYYGGPKKSLPSQEVLRSVFITVYYDSLFLLIFFNLFMCLFKIYFYLSNVDLCFITKFLDMRFCISTIQRIGEIGTSQTYNYCGELVLFYVNITLSVLIAAYSNKLITSWPVSSYLYLCSASFIAFSFSVINSFIWSF